MTVKRSWVASGDIVMPPKRSLFSTIGIILASFIAMLSNVVSLSGSNVMLPILGQELQIQPDKLQWIPSAFSLSSGCSLLLCGRLADLYGRKRVFLAGSAWMSIFAIGSGFARTATELFILRAVQGVGSAAATASAIGILAQSFPPGLTHRMAFAVFSAGAPIGGGVGLVFGGLLTQLSSVHWRAVFFLIAGLSFLSLLIGCLSMDRDLPSEELDRRVDWIGAVLDRANSRPRNGGRHASFTSDPNMQGNTKRPSTDIIASLVLGIALVVAFLFWEDHLAKRTTLPPLMRLDIWTRARGKFAAIQLVAFLEWCAFMSWMLWVQLYFQSYKHYSPLATTVRLIPTSVTGFIITMIVGAIAGWVPAIYMLSIGTVATGIACLLFAMINVDATYWACAFPSTILAVWGADFIFASGAMFITRVALAHEQSVAGGILQTCTQLGTSFGLAITTIVHNRVSNWGTGDEAQLRGYRAAQWTGFAFAMIAFMISVLFFRGVGTVGGKADPDVVNLPTDSSGVEMDVKVDDSKQKIMAFDC
ncbi:hypothetical protein APHAL10511_003371 [Amanita phalloides]|nr:hypothetical protein APHAL10511_003371 [Amanita phalloides]